MAKLTKDELNSFQGKLFPKAEEAEEEKVKYLFEQDGNVYKLPEDYDEIAEGSLFDDKFDLQAVAGNNKIIINFNNVKTIGKNSFENLEFMDGDLEFYFDSNEVIDLKPEAFGDNFSKLNAMKGNNKTVKITMSSETFKNHNVIKNMDTIEGVNLYLHGKWTKEELKRLIKIIDNHEISQASDKTFGLSDGKFTSEDLTEDQLIKLSNNLIKLITDNETANKLIETKKEAQKTTPEIKSWNNIDEVTGKKMIDFVLNAMAEDNLSIKVKADTNKAEIKDGKVILNNETFTDIQLINGNRSLVGILKTLSKEEFNGIQLEFNAENMEAIIVAIKNSIKKNWESITDRNIKYKIKGTAWNLLNEDTRRKMIKYILDTVKEDDDFHIIATVDANKTEIIDGKMILKEESFDKILFGQSKLKTPISTLLDGIKLKNDKTNRGEVKTTLKDYIKRNWEEITASGIKYNITVINAEGKDIVEDKHVSIKKAINDMTSADKYLGRFLEEYNDKEKISIEKIRGKEVIKCLIIIGKEHMKNKKKGLAKSCADCINTIMKSENNNMYELENKTIEQIKAIKESSFKTENGENNEKKQTIDSNQPTAAE